VQGKGFKTLAIVLHRDIYVYSLMFDTSVKEQFEFPLLHFNY